MLGILCGLESEAKIARKIPGALVACAAASPRKGRDLAQGLVGQGATKLMSFGIAGSLESSVFLGDVFVGTRVVSAKGQWPCDETWGHTLTEKFLMPNAAASTAPKRSSERSPKKARSTKTPAAPSSIWKANASPKSRPQPKSR